MSKWINESMNQSNNDQSLREQLVSLLKGGNAHASFDDFVKDFPVEKCGQRIEGLPYTAWQVLEHMRIAQWDILEFSRDAKHVSPEWPKGYWPDESEAGTDQLWSETVEKFRSDLAAFSDFISDPATDLFAEIPHGTGQTVRDRTNSAARSTGAGRSQLESSRRADRDGKIIESNLRRRLYGSQISRGV